MCLIINFFIGAKGSSCCPCCNFGNCHAFCFKVCCCCCKDVAKDPSNKYPHIHYGQLVPHLDTKQSYTDGSGKAAYTTPVQRRYKYPQKYREYTIPPELGGRGEKIMVKDELITEQPRKLTPMSVQESTQDGTTSFGSSEGLDMDVGFVDKGKRPSLSFIERSPESTLKRGAHAISFPSQSKKKMSINTLRPIDDALRQKLEELRPESSPIQACVYFSMYFDDQKMMLIVHVNRAVNLPTRRPEATSNPFLQIYLLPSKVEVQQSHSMDGTHSPVFDKVFRFSHMPVAQLRGQMVVMRFYININHFVGGLVHSLHDADFMGNKNVMEISEFDEEEGLKVSNVTSRTPQCSGAPQ